MCANNCKITFKFVKVVQGKLWFFPDTVYILLKVFILEI